MLAKYEETRAGLHITTLMHHHYAEHSASGGIFLDRNLSEKMKEAMHRI